MAEDVPHRVRYDSPKANRDAVTIALSLSDKNRLRGLECLAEETFDESVYTLDVRLAALRAGLRDENAFIDEMREMGYGLFD